MITTSIDSSKTDCVIPTLLRYTFQVMLLRSRKLRRCRVIFTGERSASHIYYPRHPLAVLATVGFAPLAPRLVPLLLCMVGFPRCSLRAQSIFFQLSGRSRRARLPALTEGQVYRHVKLPPPNARASRCCKSTYG